MTRYKAFIPKCFRSKTWHSCQRRNREERRDLSEKKTTYLNVTPYCETASKLAFQTRVTSQEVVACSLQERKAEIALLPTAQ